MMQIISAGKQPPKVYCKKRNKHRTCRQEPGFQLGQDLRSLSHTDGRKNIFKWSHHNKAQPSKLSNYCSQIMCMCLCFLQLPIGIMIGMLAVKVGGEQLKMLTSTLQQFSTNHNLDDNEDISHGQAQAWILDKEYKVPQILLQHFCSQDPWQLLLQQQSLPCKHATIFRNFNGE